MSKDVFLSVGADGSLRAFDLRALEHSTILYETPSAKAPSPPDASSASHARHQATDSTASAIPAKPLARISFSQKEQHYLAIFGFGDTAASILDMRNPGVPVAELVGHQKGLSAVGWGCESRASHGGGGWVATCGEFSRQGRLKTHADILFLLQVMIHSSCYTISHRRFPTRPLPYPPPTPHRRQTPPADQRNHRPPFNPSNTPRPSTRRKQEHRRPCPPLKNSHTWRGRRTTAKSITWRGAGMRKRARGLARSVASG